MNCQHISADARSSRARSSAATTVASTLVTRRTRSTCASAGTKRARWPRCRAKEPAGGQITPSVARRGRPCRSHLSFERTAAEDLSGPLAVGRKTCPAPGGGNTERLVWWTQSFGPGSGPSPRPPLARRRNVVTNQCPNRLVATAPQIALPDPATKGGAETGRVFGPQPTRAQAWIRVNEVPQRPGRASSRSAPCRRLASSWGATRASRRCSSEAANRRGRRR